MEDMKRKMVTHFESLLSKMVGWSKKSAERNDCVRWPQNMLACLEEKFHLLPKDMAVLQCIGHKRWLAGSPVSFVRIFDRAKAYGQGIIVEDYHDLNKHPELVLFEGHILKNGTVHLRKKESTVAGE